MIKYKKYIYSGTFVIVAVILVLIKYWDYVANPWTRDGKVRAEIVQIATRISGPIINLPIRDNQFVRAGDLLFEIDPRTYQVSLDQALAQLGETGDDVQALDKEVDAAKAAVDVEIANIQQVESSIKEIDAQIEKNNAEYERQKLLLPKGSTSQKAVDNARSTYEVSLEQKKGAQASLEQAKAAVRKSRAAHAKAKANLGQLGKNNSQIKAALAAVKQAELNMEFTRVLAPVDGYITNLNLRKGSQMVANQPVLALVDINSYWVVAYFRENLIKNINSGNRAVVTLMSYPNKPIKAEVESLGWGISQSDGSTGFELLPEVNPTFEWIRLAQRIPVRIRLTDVPEDIKLRVGTTCSVIVFKKYKSK
jgi:multidrug resistance efflux pump